MQALLVLLVIILFALVVAIWRIHSRHRSFRSLLQAALEAQTNGDVGLLTRAASLTSRAHHADQQAERLEGALDTAPLGIIIVDQYGTQVYANRVADTYFVGDSGDAVVGLRLRELITAGNATNEPLDREIEILSPLPRTILLRTMPLFDGEERRGTVAFTDDLTPRSQIDTIRRDFVANASHELKTPLGALRLLAEALVVARDDKTRESLSERLQMEATRMTRLVDDILDLALIQEDHLVSGVVDICDVINDSILQASLASETLAVPVECECASVEVLGDHRRLVSAVANLIENAITYTGATGADAAPPVVVRGFRSDDQARIEVEDHGIGIAARHQTRIFERFYRVDQGRSRGSGGTGLGLAIVRHVVENHSGEVEVESVPGKGSTFRIMLPAREKQLAERPDS